jgi:hypothetical protein
MDLHACSDFLQRCRSVCANEQTFSAWQQTCSAPVQSCSRRVAAIFSTLAALKRATTAILCGVAGHLCIHAVQLCNIAVGADSAAEKRDAIAALAMTSSSHPSMTPQPICDAGRLGREYAAYGTDSIADLPFHRIGVSPAEMG